MSEKVTTSCDFWREERDVCPFESTTQQTFLPQSVNIRLCTLLPRKKDPKKDDYWSTGKFVIQAVLLSKMFQLILIEEMHILLATDTPLSGDFASGISSSLVRSNCPRTILNLLSHVQDKNIETSSFGLCPGLPRLQSVSYQTCALKASHCLIVGFIVYLKLTDKLYFTVYVHQL